MTSLRHRDNRLIRLDRRYSHSGLFTHMVQFHLKDGYQVYHDALKFCYDNWGMSIDVETYARIYHDAKLRHTEFAFSTEWSYMDKYGDHRVYLTDAAASWFRLSGTWDL